ncbi:MAG: NB-ARC domain-containing protein [Acidobacteriota bacterium]
MSSSYEERPTILYVAANPTGPESLRLDVEFREIQESLTRTRSRLRLQQRWATRTMDLRRALLEHQPEYLHISAHGNDDGLVLEDDDGVAKLVDRDALADLFSLFSPGLRCVLLNSCYSADQASAIAQSIKYVIGTTSAVRDRTASAFSVAFYDAIANNKDIGFAFELGRTAVALEGAGNADLFTLHRQRTTGQYQDWPSIPENGQLFGRDQELRILERWVHEDDVRLLLVLGFGGIGKTRLSARFGRGGLGKTSLARTYAKNAQYSFDKVIWRSLVGAPTVEELVESILAGVNHWSPEADETSRSRSSVEDLADCLKSEKILLILDNFESVMSSGDVETTGASSSSFSRLILTLGQLEHRGCVILTSREKPRQIEKLEGDNRPVRTLLLRGLDVYNGKKIFEEIGKFSASDQEWRKLIEFYDGNPLALELAARHIQSVYRGDIREFLNQAELTILDLESLLNWHVSRLSKMELEVLYWLAIDREPVALPELRDDLLSSDARKQLASTVHTLQRLMPLERKRLRIGLQPVLLDYLTRRFVQQIGDEIRLSPSWVGRFIGRKLASEVKREFADDSSFDLLRRFALIKSTSKSYVRRSQRRLILRPIVEWFEEQGLLRDELSSLLVDLLGQCREETREDYVAGNLISLLIEILGDLSNLDLSHLVVRQVDFQSVDLRNTSLAYSTLRQVRFRSQFGHIHCVAMTLDGQTLACGDTKGVIHLWKVEDQEPLAMLEGHVGWIRSVEFSPDGRFLVSASEDQTVRVWALRDYFCEATLIGHQSWVNSAVFDTSGRHVVSGGEDGTVRVWEWRTGTCLKEFGPFGSRTRAVQVIPGASKVISGSSDGTIRVIDLQTGQVERHIEGHSDWISSIDLDKEGATLATAGFDCCARLWELSSSRLVCEFRGHSSWIWDVTLSPDRDLLATASRDRTVKIWSTSSGDCVNTIGNAHDGTVRALKFFPNGDRLASVGQDQALKIWDVHDGSKIGSLRGYSNSIWSIVPGTESGCILSGGDDGIVRKWNIDTGACLESRGSHRGRIWALSATHGLVVSGGSDKRLKIWTETDVVEVARIRAHDDWILSVDLSTSGKLLATGSSNRDPVVKLWSTHTGKLVSAFHGHEDRVHGVAVFEKEGLLVSSGDDSSVRFWSMDERSEVFRVELDFDGVRGKLSPFAVAKSSRLFAVATSSGLAIWDVVRRIESLTISPVSGVPTAVMFDALGKKLFLCTSSGTLEAWDLTSGEVDLVIRSPRNVYQAVCPVGNGDSLCASTATGELDIFELETGNLVKTMIAPRPYEGLRLKGSKGLTRGQQSVLYALGATSEE